MFRCFVEAFAVYLAKNNGADTHAIKDQYQYLVEQYPKALQRAEKAEVDYEASHQQMYVSREEPGEIQKEQHKLIVEERTNANEAFPELIRKMISLFRDLRRLESQPSVRKDL